MPFALAILSSSFFSFLKELSLRNIKLKKKKKKLCER